MRTLEENFLLLFQGSLKYQTDEILKLSNREFVEKKQITLQTKRTLVSL